MRMGPRLAWRAALPDGLAELAFPPNMLISLVENAIKHGLEPSADGGTVSIEARRNGDLLVGAALAFFGFIHAGTLSPAGGVYDITPGAGSKWTIGDLLSAGFFALTGWWVEKSGQNASKD